MKYEIKPFANLRSAYLCSANLTGADLRSADLTGADLCSANLTGADLTSANLRSADLTGADLRSANLCSANLRSADLRSADLCSADLRSADLRSANLRSANLCSANLRSANLCSANLRSATLPQFLRLPSTGPFRCWKKLADGSIAELWVPREAGRVSCITSNKCRVERAKVVAIEGPSNAKCSKHDPSVVYRVGEWVEPDSYDDDERVPCTHGIHVFATRQEAVDYLWT